MTAGFVPLISTFVSTPDEVAFAIESGATRLILEDSKITIRSFHDDWHTGDFAKYGKLAEIARCMNPSTLLTVGIDMLTQNGDFERVSQAVRQAVEAG
ncbi:hypothetical protein EBR96_05090, partial [bacterium]|nr:hypothetical protein [bacterium]